MVNARPTGFEDQASFAAWFEKCCAELGGTRENPSIAIFDGASCHISRAVSRIAVKHNCYLIVLPSHTSTETQYCDNGLFSLFERCYADFFVAHIYSSDGAQRKLEFTPRERLRIVCSTLHWLEGQKVTLRKLWSRIALPDGKFDSSRAKYTPKTFRAGLVFRDESLPGVTRRLLDDLFSLRNVIRPPRSPHIIRVARPQSPTEESTFSLPDGFSGTIFEYILGRESGATDKPRAFFAHRHTALPRTLAGRDLVMTEIWAEVRSCHVLLADIDHFLVERALSGPSDEDPSSTALRVPPIDTSQGLLLTTEHAIRHLAAAEQAQQAKAAEGEAKRRRKLAQNALEQPIIDVLAATMVEGAPIRPLTSSKSPTVAQMKKYIGSKDALSSSKLKTRTDFVQYMLKHVALTTFVE